MIASVQNTRVKNWNKLKMKKERLKTKTYLIEGYHLVEEAIKSGCEIEELITDSAVNLPIFCEGLPHTTVTKKVFEHFSNTDQPQGIAAVVRMKSLEIKRRSPVLLIDEIRDPGNLGTMIRTADAAGFKTIILGEGTVDLYNDKVIRATQGSIFHIQIMEGKLAREIVNLQKDGFQVWASALSEAVTYDEVLVTEKIALMIGNEGRGIDRSLIDLADKCVKIPIYGKAESLNAGVAAGILMYYIKGKLASRT